MICTGCINAQGYFPRRNADTQLIVLQTSSFTLTAVPMKQSL